MRKIAVVGASLAGLSAARALRAQGFDGEVSIVGAEVHRPYDRPPLSKQFLAGRLDRAALRLETDDEDLGVCWRLGTRALSLDAPSASLELSDGSRLGADGVVLATGAAARHLPGTAGAAGLAGVHVVRTVDDAVGLRADLLPGARLVVIGAGFVGSEVASTARSLGLDVTVLEAATTPLSGPLGVEMGAAIARLHTGHGTDLRCGVGVAGLRGTGSGKPDRVTAVELADGRSVAADVVVVAVGATPAVEWLHGSGVVWDNGIVCDAAGATSVPHVVAVGDCASWYDAALGRPHRVEHWTGAAERPAVAVATLLAGDGRAAPARPVRGHYFWSDQYGVRIQFAGVTVPGDEVCVESGDIEDGSFLAVYRRHGEPVAVLGVDQVRLFTRWRRQLAVVAAPGAGPAPGLDRR